MSIKSKACIQASIIFKFPGPVFNLCLVVKRRKPGLVLRICLLWVCDAERNRLVEIVRQRLVFRSEPVLVFHVYFECYLTENPWKHFIVQHGSSFLAYAVLEILIKSGSSSSPCHFFSCLAHVVIHAQLVGASPEFITVRSNYFIYFSFQRFLSHFGVAEHRIESLVPVV